MHGLFFRASAVFYAWTTALMVLSAVVALGSLYHFDVSSLNKADIQPHFVSLAECKPGSRCPRILNTISHWTPAKRLDYVDLRLQSHVDLTNLFHWNTKQVFLWLTVEYETKNFEYNVISVWDEIFQRDLYDELVLGKKYHYEVKFKKIRPEYEFIDLDEALPGSKVNLTLNWDIMPFVGFVQPTLSKGSVSFDIPKNYTK